MSGGPFDGFGRVLREIRTERRLTQAELAARSGASESMLSNYEGGKQRPHLDTLERLLTALGVSLGELATRLEPERTARLRDALRYARGAETALQAIPQDGPDPELHQHLIVRASDLCTELKELLRGEGCRRLGGEQ